LTLSAAMELTSDRDKQISFIMGHDRGRDENV
jgi:hypothetical protein